MNVLAIDPEPRTDWLLEVFVPGIAQPAGSKRGFAFTGKDGKTHVAISDANPKSRTWKTEVKEAVAARYNGAPLDGPLSVVLAFVHLRPKGHFRTGKNADLLKDSAPSYPAGKPDVLKLARGVEDALTGIAWRDDAQIVEELISKHYGDRPGVFIRVKGIA